MSNCGCNNNIQKKQIQSEQSVRKEVKTSDSHEPSGTRRSFNLRMKDNCAEFHLSDPCKEYHFGGDCVKIPDLICYVNNKFGSCISPCALVQFGKLTDNCTSCCDKNVCRGIVANFFSPCSGCCDQNNFVGELWTLMILSSEHNPKSSKILFRSNLNGALLNYYSFEIRRKCFPSLSCCGNIVTHKASATMNVFGIIGCFEGRTGCCELNGDFGADYHENSSLVEVIESEDYPESSLELNWVYEFCLEKTHCDSTPIPELKC